MHYFFSRKYQDQACWNGTEKNPVSSSLEDFPHTLCLPLMMHLCNSRGIDRIGSRQEKGKKYRNLRCRIPIHR